MTDLNNLIEINSSIAKIGKIKIQTFWGPTASTEKQEVNFPEPFENACLSVIVTCRNGATGNIPSFDITDYKANKFYLRANTGNVSTFITAIGY